MPKPDNRAPSVNITSPTAGSTIAGVIAISVTATDNVGVAHVDIYFNGTLIASIYAAPYSMSFDSTLVANGAATILAKAFDRSGNYGKKSISVTVANATYIPPPPPSYAGPDYFVDNVAGSDSNDGASDTTPWKSLAKVNAFSFQPGDVVGFKCGSVWQGKLLCGRTGTSIAPITYQPYGSGSAPEIQNPNGGSSAHCVEVTGKYNIIDGFLFTQCHDVAVVTRLGADHNIVRNCEFTKGSGEMGGATYFGSAFNLVSHCSAHDLTMIVSDATSNNDYGAVAFSIAGPDNEIAYCRGERCYAASIDYGIDGGFVEVWQNGDRLHVHHCWAENTRGFMELGGNTGASAVDVVVDHNVLVNTFDLMCWHASDVFAINIQRFKFENNTVYRDETAQWTGLLCRSDFSQLTMRNNVFYTNQRIGPNGTFVHTNNLYHMTGGAIVGYSLGAGEIAGDPLFVDSAGRDFHLQAGSVAIDAGADLGYSIDYDANPVPVGALPDIGAFEKQ